VTVYEQLQADLDAALREMRKQEAKAASLVASLAAIFQKQAGFPTGAFSYRANMDEAREQSSAAPADKIERRNEGTLKVTMDIRIDAASHQTPIQLPAQVPGSHSFTFISLEVRFTEKQEIELAIEDDASSRIQLSGITETDRQHLASFSNLIRKRIEDTIRWVATGEGNPTRRMGFHAT